MLSTFRRLFQVLPDEGGKVLVFALLAGLLQAGVAIGMVAADSLFLAGLGIEMLPLVFIFMPVVMLVYAPLYSLLVAGLGVRALFRLTLTALVIGGLAFGFGGERFGDQTWFLFAAKFYAGLWFIALYTLFWNFADDYFSILDGKRLYGLIAAGSAAGSMIGGGLVSGLTGLVPATKLFLVWSIVAILTSRCSWSRCAATARSPRTTRPPRRRCRCPACCVSSPPRSAARRSPWRWR